MKKIKTKKELIKNIAIVFLVIMLILTFFSNTIMNMSLVEVNGEYTEYGTIRTGVRGSGSVQATSVFEQTAKAPWKVLEVYVRQGDRIQKDQPIMRVESAGSDELNALEAELKSLKQAYDKALIAKDSAPDYTLSQMNIDDKKAELSELRAEREAFTEEKVLEIFAEHDSAEEAVEQIQERIDALEEELLELSEKSDNEQIVAARQKRDRAASAFEYAEECLEKAERELAEIGGITSLDSLQAQYSSLGRTLADLYEEKLELEAEYAPLFKLEADMQTAKSELDRISADTSATPEQIADAQTKYDTSLALYEAKKDEIKAARNTMKSLEKEIDDTGYEQGLISNQIREAKSDNNEYERRKTAVDIAQTSYDDTKKVLDGAEEDLKKVVESVSKDTSDSLKESKKSLKDAEERLEKASEDKKKAENLDEMDKSIRGLEKELFEMEYNLEKQKESDTKQESLENYDLNIQREEIAALEEEIAKLRGGEESGEFEVLSKYTGIISSFNPQVGQTLPKDSSFVTVESEDTGFTLSFSAKSEDARKVSIGDTASVSGGWWGSEISAVLRDVKNEVGGKTKLLEFDITGDVSAGQTLTLIVGEKSTSFAAVIPKSAVREDKDGKYVYITETKSTPLGNRYEVVRLPVEVQASDDVNSAISNPDISYLYEFVITSSTGPIAEGDYVRLAD